MLSTTHGVEYMMKIVLAAVAFCLILIPSANAWAEHHCFSEGGEIHCQHGWIWQDRREWREDEWRDRMRHHEHDHDHDEWNYRR